MPLGAGLRQALGHGACTRDLRTVPAAHGPERWRVGPGRRHPRVLHAACAPGQELGPLGTVLLCSSTVQGVAVAHVELRVGFKQDSFFFEV